ncbi:hypothetical protein ACFQI3_12550 [Hansschlegelia quercus]|uniref:Uncharacterized protein n=1 Tax=Hansschlegelia quercus TaxID=2528245 RepID=A0A4Q9GKV3_9HYPH|nr:hypothetical protein [Hansschlegelia quercus]TBN53324.1 hypothetical protein EYR15_09890 [Hansschlegelia quercus]
MTELHPGLVALALEKCEGSQFEKFAQTVFGAVLGPSFKPLGGTHDGGADGFFDVDILEDTSKPTTFFQATRELDYDSKIARTITRLRQVGRSVNRLYYATPRTIKLSDRAQIALSDKYEVDIRIFDGNFFQQNANFSPDVVAAFNAYLRPYAAFVETAQAPSFPSAGLTNNAQAISAFLGQEMERRLGTARTLESVCDSLILWALESTDPDQGILMTENEIIEKVENVIPTAKQFFRGEVHTRLSRMSTKIAGERLVNIYKRENKYCLPYETRQVLDDQRFDDEALKLAVTASFVDRIRESDPSLGGNTVDTIAIVIHSTLEAVFEKQGIGASRHFLSEDVPTDDALENTAIIEIAETKLSDAGFKGTPRSDVLTIVKNVLRGVFYNSNESERTYCSRLARTYILLFSIRNTPQIIEYFNTMAKNFILYIGSDLIVRALSEFYLPQEDQMTVNTFKILRQSGSRLILTEAMLEEVHSHIYAANLEYENYYYDIEPIVDAPLASQSDRILIRAYYYAKFDLRLASRPASWKGYLNNFLTASKMSGSVSPVSLKSLKDTVCARFGMEFEDKSTTSQGLKDAEVKKLARTIREMRPPGRHEKLSENDASMILRIDQSRRTKENKIVNPIGFRTWYLTQDGVSGAATSKCFPERRHARYVMRPEFLVNYIAYNPTDAQVRQSLRTIFPSKLGIRLGSRMDGKAIEGVLNSIKQAYSVDPARASAIVAEHADALKSDRMRAFAIKFEPKV